MKIINSKIFKTLVLLFVVGFVFGIVFFIFGSKNNTFNYYNDLENGNINYFISLFKTLLFNYKYAFVIWICGLLFVLSFFIPLIVTFRGVCLGFLVSTTIYIFKIKGLIISLIILFPCTIINELLYLFLSYYAINNAIKIYNAIKKDKMINIRLFFKNYYLKFIVFLFVLLVSSLFEVYITSNIIKFML